MVSGYNEATAAMDGSPAALNALLNVAGAIRVARNVVLREAGPNEDLAAAEGVLVLAEREAERVYTWLEEEGRKARRAAAPAEEEAHDG
jgi:hypothetical protein